MVSQFQPAIWCGQLEPCPVPLIFSLPCPKEQGRLLRKPILASSRLARCLGSWVTVRLFQTSEIRGSRIPQPRNMPYAKGKIVAQNIAAVLLRRPLKSFSFKTIGLLASIGRRMGVARIFGFNFSGFFAWWLWRTVYLSKLPGLDKKIRVAFDWTLDLLFPKDVCAVYDLDHDGRQFPLAGPRQKHDQK